jgi:hypothetical protein
MMMMNVFITMLAMVAIVCVHGAPMAVCNFDEGVGLSGSIMIETTAEGIFLDFSGVTDPDTVLTANNNEVHIHKWGFNTYTNENCDAIATSGHYNPILNYGEPSCYNGYFDSVNVSDLMWDHPAYLTGAMGILGRSIVIHKEGGARVACCNVELSGTDITGAAAPDYDVEGECGIFAIDQNSTHFSLSNIEGDDYFFTFFDNTADCAAAVGSLNATMTNLIPAFQTMYRPIDEMSLIGPNQVAGTAMAISFDGVEFSCCTVVVKTAGVNCPADATPCDICVPMDGTTEEMMMSSDEMMMSSEMMSSDGMSTDSDVSVSVLVSIALLFVSLF